MSIREKGSIWPLMTVGTVAFLVLIVPTLIMQRNQNSRMATVEAQVSIGDLDKDAATASTGPKYRWPDSEVPRTAERLRDASAVAIAAITYAVEGAMSGHAPRDVGDIETGMVRRQLIPDEWISDQSGVLTMPHGTVHLRYSPRNLMVEAVSVPNDRRDGPPLLIRLPDSENTMVGPRYFESMQLDGIVYPNPFAPIPDIISAGWRPRLFKQTQMPDAERGQLEQWAKAALRK